MDLRKEILNETDINYLMDLDRYVDIDIDNIGKGSIKFREMKASMWNISVEEMEKQQLKSFLELKSLIKEKLEKLLNECK